MFQKRTDLALEIHELHGTDSGITVENTTKNGLAVTTARINSPSGEKLSGKNSGEYITVDIGSLTSIERGRLEIIAKTIADEIKALLPMGDGCVLVAGLGNKKITPDSLGPKVVENLLVTRHIKTIDEALFKNAGFGCVAAISPGVLGQTGIESAEIIKSICGSIKPKCVVVIDSLASRRLNRLATTVQLSNGGISPGSGVANKRAELSEKTLGVRVISIGVPTVVDAATLAFDLLEEHFGKSDEGFSSAIEKILLGDGRNMFVTPKESDVITDKTAKLLADSLNIALHNLEMNEINDFLN